MEYSFNICLKNRQLLEGLLNRFNLDQLNKIPEGFSNNIIWNIGHSIATQQLLVYGLSGQEMLVTKEFIDRYRKGTKPEREATTAEVAEIKSLLFSTLEQLEKDYASGIFKEFKQYTLGTTGGVLHKVEHAIEFNNFHEGLHLGSCIALAKFV